MRSSLDDVFINNNGALTFTNGGRTRTRVDAGSSSGSGSGYGPTRRFINHHKQTRPSPYTTSTRMQESEMKMKMKPNGGFNEESEAKLYISNLDYGVTTNDIKLLFSDIGEMRSQSVHCDKGGRSTGTAEVVFARQIDALAAIRKYNNLPLDGRPMVLELVGADSFLHPLRKRSSVFDRISHGTVLESAGAGGQGNGGSGGQKLTKTQGQARHCCEKEIPTVAELDADFERYRFEAYVFKKR